MLSKKEIYKQQFTQEDFPGLEAINKRQKEIYGDQEPTHWATIVPYELGGKDPLWATECYDSDKQKRHFHHMSLGFTNLYYDDEYAEDEINGFGFELTFRHLPVPEDPDKPVWPSNLLQNIARYVFDSKKVFDDYHFMSANGPLRMDTQTDITAMVFVTDPEMGEIETPHGHMKFLQIYGITSREYQDLKEKNILVAA
ncbi:suppressor of fused domain protein [Mucilaginibacter sp. AW1-3]